MTVVICGPPQGIHTRVVIPCSTCEMPTVFVRRFMGAWYPDLVTCSLCGDQWCEGERLERPFRRGWRAEQTARARTDLDTALPRSVFERRVIDEIDFQIAGRP